MDKQFNENTKKAVKIVLETQKKVIVALNSLLNGTTNLEEVIKQIDSIYENAKKRMPDE